MIRFLYVRVRADNKYYASRQFLVFNQLAAAGGRESIASSTRRKHVLTRLFGGGACEEAGELCARADAELLINRTDVLFHGLTRNKETLRDCGISEPGCNALGDFALPLRKHVV